jgi:hypothetical protein
VPHRFPGTGFPIGWGMMEPVTIRSIPAPVVHAHPDGTDSEDRAAAIARLHDVFADGGISFVHFTVVLDRILAAPDHADLEVAMVTLPPLVAMTPAWRRLGRPLVLRSADGRLPLGPGWQLAARTTVSTGSGVARLDLTAASWDARQIDLRLETWGTIEVLVPEGATVVRAGGSRPVALFPLAPAVPGGPVVRVSTVGPEGEMRIGHPGKRCRTRLLRPRRRHPAPVGGAARP